MLFELLWTKMMMTRQPTWPHRGRRRVCRDNALTWSSFHVVTTIWDAGSRLEDEQPFPIGMGCPVSNNMFRSAVQGGIL